MGMHGTWFVAREAEVAATWRWKKQGRAINPFGGVAVDSDRRVIELDHASLARLFAREPILEGKFLSDWQVSLLVGARFEEVVPSRGDDGMPVTETSITRMSDAGMRVLLATTTPDLLARYAKAVASSSERIPYSEAIDAGVVERLKLLARAAQDAAAHVYCHFE